MSVSGHPQAPAAVAVGTSRFPASTLPATTSTSASTSVSTAASATGADAPPAHASASGARSTVELPAESESYFSALLNRTLRITVRDSRVFIGTFICVDKLCNIVLSCTDELRGVADFGSVTESHVTGDAEAATMAERSDVRADKAEVGNAENAEDAEGENGENAEGGNAENAEGENGQNAEGENAQNAEVKSAENAEGENGEKENQEGENGEGPTESAEAVRRNRAMYYPASARDPRDGPGRGGRFVGLVMVPGAEAVKIELVEDDGMDVL